MVLTGRIIKGSKVLKEKMICIEENNASYRDILERCFLNVCKELNIAVPLWLKKNTREYSRYKRTSFDKDQFIEPVSFDRFEIIVEEA